MMYRARNSQLAYGRPIGILVLAERIPSPPGTVANPTTFRHPVCYEIVRDAHIDSLKALNQPDTLPAFIRAAETLVERGVSAIAGNCGLMIVHQAALARHLPVPVFMSSLVQLPLLEQMFGAGACIGVMAASRNSLRPEHLQLASPGTGLRLVLGTMDEQPNFRSAVGQESGVLDTEKAEAEAVAVARDVVSSHPEMRAILLECTDLPPYAAAIQDAVGLPIFDMTTLIDMAAASIARRPFLGVY